jgi:hypothetical protein
MLLFSRRYLCMMAFYFFPIQDYAEIAITNFTTSWSDGLAFIALIHRFRPDLFDYELVSRKPANARLEYAFRMANKHLEIARLLDPEGELYSFCRFPSTQSFLVNNVFVFFLSFIFQM